MGHARVQQQMDDRAEASGEWRLESGVRGWGGLGRLRAWAVEGLGG